MMKGQSKRFTMKEQYLSHEEMLEIAKQREEANEAVDDTETLDTDSNSQ